jgi:PDZ domain-containing protein
VLLILLVPYGLSRISLSTYAITPGDAQPVGPLIKVAGLGTDPTHDVVMLTDVYLVQLNALTWIKAQFQSPVEFVNQDQLVEKGVPTEQLVAQGYIDMAQSKDFAKVSALSELGWKIPATASGATVYAVRTHTPAATAGLQVGDRIVKVDGTAIHNDCQLVSLTRDRAPGTVVTLGVRRAHISDAGLIVLGPTKSLRLTLGTPTANLTSECPGESGAATSYMGLVADDAVDYTFPGHIAISTPNIGGPSAGLAMTLGLLDRLSPGSLTGGVPIAATGTIDALGHVGDVGGVAEKTVAVERGGAKIFLVPDSEVAVAKSASNGKLRVIGVSTLDQAVTALRGAGQPPLAPFTKPYPLMPTT